MTLEDKFRYDRKRVLVVGGATGMGAAGAELAAALGAEVTVMDYAEIKLAGVKRIRVNLAEKASIDAALREVEGPVHALFSCAGVADGTPGIECINFVGHRYLIDKLVGDSRLPRGSAVCCISSSAGLGWEANFAELSELLDIRDFDAAAAWLRAHGKANYMGTKQAICAYVAREAYEFIRRGIRINAVCPGPTDTPLAQAHQWLGMGADFRAAVGIEASSSMDQAYPMVFLCSDAASVISGVTLVGDLGWFNAGLVHTFPGATPIAEFLMGRKLSFPSQK
jgi:NAD(P)-dependent dehydrogenase (short-subunit alcohol dehydrogenase family)